MKFTVECRTCGHQFEPPREAILLGTWHRCCPVCHPPVPPQRVTPIVDDVEAA